MVGALGSQLGGQIRSVADPYDIIVATNACSAALISDVSIPTMCLILKSVFQFFANSP